MSYEPSFHPDALAEWKKLDGSVREVFKKKLAERLPPHVSQIFDTMHISASNPFSIVAFEAGYWEGETWLDELLAYLRDTRDYVENYLAAHLPKIRLIKPEGTYLLWLDCRELRMSDAQLKHFFVHEAGVGLSPGILFGEGGSGFMRMNIAAPRHVIVAALESIRKVIRS